MKRNSKKPSAIITADIELRIHPPVSRIDNYWETLTGKIKWLSDLQKKYNCPIFDGGDLFDKRYKQSPSHFLIQWAIKNIPTIYSVPGNHDLPGKTIDNYDNSAMASLQAAGKVFGIGESFCSANNNSFYLYRIPYGQELKEPEEIPETDFRVVLFHGMVYDNNPPFPGCEGWEKKEVLRKFPNFDLIVTGDNHQTFTGKLKNTLLVNAGSMMRNDADQEDHRPCVFLWYPEEFRVEQVFYPIKQGVLSREHLDKQQDKETRISAFVEKLGQQVVEGINFEKNLEQFLLKNNVNQRIIDKCWKYFEGGV
jgi:predicted phosphodiesterase